MAGKIKAGEILIYQTESGDTKVDVFFENGTVWMTQKQIALLYGRAPNTISGHINGIYFDKELMMESTCRKYRLVQEEGKRIIERDTLMYNLDMILAIGYRVLIGSLVYVYI